MNKSISLDQNKLRTYIDQVGYKKDDILSDLRRVTESLGDISIMQIGQTQGSLIEMLCRIGGFSKCIEIGVFTGYSSICIAKGIPEDGKLYALDNSIEFIDIAKEYWTKSGCDKKIELIKSNINSVDDIDNCVKYILMKEGTLDILINNACIGFTCPIE